MTAPRPDLAVVQPGPETALDRRARICNEGHRARIRLEEKAAAYAVEVGCELIAAKEELGHGNWTAWCDENLIFSKRTAERYMYVAHSPLAESAANSGSSPRRSRGWYLGLRRPEEAERRRRHAQAGER